MFFLFGIAAVFYFVAVYVAIIGNYGANHLKQAHLNKIYKNLPPAQLESMIDQKVVSEPEFERCGTYAPIDNFKRAWPWHVMIYYDIGNSKRTNFIRVCGGTLISKRHIISYFACFLYIDNKGNLKPRALEKYRAAVGRTTEDWYTVGKDEQRTMISSVKAGMNDTDTTTTDVVAYVTVPVDSIKFSNWVRPICLYLNKTRESMRFMYGHNGVIPYINETEKELNYTIVFRENCSRLYDRNDTRWTKLSSDIFCGVVTYVGFQPMENKLCTVDKGSGYAQPDANRIGNESRYYLRGVFTETADTEGCSTLVKFVHITSLRNRILLLLENLWYDDHKK